MKDVKEVIEVEENEVEEVETVEENKLEKIKNSKPVTFMKKHGKKFAIAAGIGAAFLIGRALGEKDGFALGEFANDGDDTDDNVIDIHNYSVSEETTENEEE